jgi:hypothetical protein
MRPNQIPVYIGMVRDSETQLAESLAAMADRHSSESEIREGCTRLARWSRGHVNGLEQHIDKYGAAPTTDPQRMRSALFHGARVGGLGTLRDLHDLFLLAQQTRMSWTVLCQAAKTVHDAQLENDCVAWGAQTDRQIEWLKTQLKHISPQALTVPADMPDEVEASIPKEPSPAGLPDAQWSPLAGGLIVLLVGLVGWLFGKPWLLPSLGPTAYLQAETPAHPNSSFYNTVVGHLLGLVVGFLAVMFCGAMNAPAVLTDHQLVLARVLAAALAVALTLLLAPLVKATHPPAAATTLLVALGSIKTLNDAFNLAIGVLLVAAIGSAFRQIRLRSSVAAAK